MDLEIDYVAVSASKQADSTHFADKRFLNMACIDYILAIQINPNIQLKLIFSIIRSVAVCELPGSHVADTLFHLYYRLHLGKSARQLFYGAYRLT